MLLPQHAAAPRRWLGAPRPCQQRLDLDVVRGPSGPRNRVDLAPSASGGAQARTWRPNGREPVRSTGPAARGAAARSGPSGGRQAAPQARLPRSPLGGVHALPARCARAAGASSAARPSGALRQPLAPLAWWVAAPRPMRSRTSRGLARLCRRLAGRAQRALPALLASGASLQGATSRDPGCPGSTPFRGSASAGFTSATDGSLRSVQAQVRSPLAGTVGCAKPFGQLCHAARALRVNTCTWPAHLLLCSLPAENAEP